MASKTARASMKAGMGIQTKVDPFDTNEKKIAELRKQRTAKLAVNRFDFIDALIEEYDTLADALIKEYDTLKKNYDTLKKNHDTLKKNHESVASKEEKDFSMFHGAGGPSNDDVGFS